MRTLVAASIGSSPCYARYIEVFDIIVTNEFSIPQDDITFASQTPLWNQVPY